MAKSTLQAALKASDPIVRKYVVELEKRNAHLQTQIVKLEADKVERNNRIKALEEQWKMKKIDIRYHVPSEFGDRLGRAQERVAEANADPETIKARRKALIPSVIDTLRAEGYTVIPPKKA